MITFVDTNILLDVSLPDPEYGENSARHLEKANTDFKHCFDNLRKYISAKIRVLMRQFGLPQRSLIVSGPLFSLHHLRGIVRQYHGTH